MDEITIKYWSPHGRQEETKFQCGHTKIDMVMRAAKRVDLSNVARCTDLQKLDLSQNMLEELDLAPVAGCSSLKEVNLRSNHLTELNLWPLKDCRRLELVDIAENRLHGLDMTPIYRYPHVRIDSSVVVSADIILRYRFTKQGLISKFKLLRPDRVDWSAPPVVMWKKYSDMVENYDWAQIRERIEFVLHHMLPLDYYGAQRGLMEGLDISMLGGFDGNPELLLENAVSKMSYEEARQSVFDSAVKLIEKQLHEDGPTLFLDIEKMKDTSASKLIPLIVEKRRDEVERAVLYVKGSKVNLGHLWMTHYGYKVLSATPYFESTDFLGPGRMGTDLEGLELIRKSFDELDLELSTEKVTSSIEVLKQPHSLSFQRHMHRVIFHEYD